MVAAEIKSKVKPYYDKVGVSSSNTQVSFGEDGRFSAVIAGKQFSGTYTYDEKQSKISMKSLLFTVNCYPKRNANSIGELAKQYVGVRIGFDMK